MLAKKSSRLGFGGEVGIQTQNHISLGIAPFEFQAVEHGHAIAQRHEGKVAIAGLLEGGLDFRARAIVAHKAVVGINRQCILGRSGQGEGSCGNECEYKLFHRFSKC